MKAYGMIILPMSEAQIKLQTLSLSDDSTFIPKFWGIDGDFKNGYTVSSLDENYTGFTLKQFTRLKEAKEFCLSL